MSRETIKRKTCNEVRYSQFSSLRAATIQPRQSSTIRAASGPVGITNADAPGIETAKRPRLKTIASSIVSWALNVAVTRCAACSNRAGWLRDEVLVQIERLAAGALLVRAMVTPRDVRLQPMLIRIVPVESVKRALLPPGTVK